MSELASESHFIQRNPVEDFRQTQQSYSRWNGLVFPDKTLMIAIALLLVIGWVQVTSASIPKAGHNDGWIFSYSMRQAAYMLVGLMAAYITYHIPTSWLYRHSYKIMLLGFALLILVLLPGVSREINGAVRWIALGPINVQVSELVRVCTMIYAAAFLFRYQNQIHKSLGAMLRLLGVLACVSVLLFLQPDFGAIVVICATVLGMIFLAGVCMIRFISCALVVTIVGGFAMVAAPYRVKRLASFMNPWDDVYGTDYQLVNSLIAIGRGEVSGVGIGESLEKHHYLPEAHTDFIFSILAEETGLIGVCILVFLFGLIVWRAFVIANQADTVRLRFESCLAYGIGLWIGLQALINMSVASGLLPTKGLTLPMISYGGSSMVASMILLAILLRIDSQSRYLAKQQKPGQVKALAASHEN